MSTDDSRHLFQTALKRTEQTRRKTTRALQRLARSGRPVTFGVVAREA